MDLLDSVEQLLLNETVPEKTDIDELPFKKLGPNELHPPKVEYES